MYKPCLTPSIAPGYFRWQDVSCSPQCGAEWLRRVEESRRQAGTDAAPAALEADAALEAQEPVQKPAARKARRKKNRADDAEMSHEETAE